MSTAVGHYPQITILLVLFVLLPLEWNTAAYAGIGVGAVLFIAAGAGAGGYVLDVIGLHEPAPESVGATRAGECARAGRYARLAQKVRSNSDEVDTGGEVESAIDAWRECLEARDSSGDDVD